MVVASRFFGGLVLLPAICAASGPNPFLTPEQNRLAQAAPDPFVAHKKSSTHKKHETVDAALRPLALPPPPPLPPPLPEKAVAAAHVLAPELHEEPQGAPAVQKHTARVSCPIGELPAIPRQIGGGGALVFKIPESASRCIAGIESSEEWLHIKFFNGRELHIEIDPNPGAKPRESILRFASTTDSQQLLITQLSADNAVRRP